MTILFIFLPCFATWAAPVNSVFCLLAGDFWHARGSLPVEPLNEVVGLLAGWQQPTLMLPGNHGQASGLGAVINGRLGSQ